MIYIHIRRWKVYTVLVRVHPDKFTEVYYRGISGGYGNLAVYRLIWLYRLPPECFTDNIFYNRLPFKNYRLNRKIVKQKRNRMQESLPVWVTAYKNYRRSALPPKKYTVFKPRYRLSKPCLTCLKKNQNAPRPSEHPPVRGGKCQNV